MRGPPLVALAACAGGGVASPVMACNRPTEPSASTAPTSISRQSIIQPMVLMMLIWCVSPCTGRRKTHNSTEAV